MSRPAKKARTPLLQHRVSSGWVNADGAYPVEVIDPVDAIARDLERAAALLHHADPKMQAYGRGVLRDAAKVIAERDAEQFWRVLDARQPRAGKAGLAEVIAEMRASRTLNPETTLREFVQAAQAKGELKVREADDGGTIFTFEYLDAGVYTTRNLGKAWTAAGKPTNG